MALDLGDLDTYYDPSMTVTTNGKQYRIPAVSAQIGLWARRVAVGREDLADLEGEELSEAAARLRDDAGEAPLPDGLSMEEAMLGAELVAELAADHVPDPAVQHLAQVVFTRILGGDQLALLHARGELPNLAGPANRAERRAAAKAAQKKASGSGTTSTVAALTARKAASGSTTTTRKASGANAKAASRGRKS